MKDRKLPLLIGTLTLFVQSFSNALPEKPPGPSEDSIVEARSGLEQAKNVLTSGDFEARLEIAGAACGYFDVLDPVLDDGTPAEPTVRWLQHYLWQEREDWIATRLLTSIDCYKSHVGPLFLDALSSGSPNRRWTAYQWFAKHENPDALPLLEASWLMEKRVWARRDLLRALSRHHSTVLIEEALRLAESEDAELASAAISALKSTAFPPALVILTRLARESENWRRKEAADALEVYPGSAEALAALMEVSDSAESDVRRCSLRSLARMADASAMARVLAIAVTDPDEEVRKSAVAALNDSPWQEILDDLLQAFPDYPGVDRSQFESLVLGTWGPLLAREAQGQSRSARSETERTPGCAYHNSGPLVAENREAMRIAPPDGLSSSRCFAYPEHPGDPEGHWRLARGELVFVEDRFEADSGSWVFVRGFGPDCWLPDAQVAPPDEVEPFPGEDGVLERDFDLLAEDVYSPEFRELARAGMIRIIEPGTDLVGVSLRFRMSDAEQEAMLRRSLASDEKSLIGLNAFWSLDDEKICAFPSVVSLAKEMGPNPTACASHPETAE